MSQKIKNRETKGMHKVFRETLKMKIKLCKYLVIKFLCCSLFLLWCNL